MWLKRLNKLISLKCSQYLPALLYPESFEFQNFFRHAASIRTNPGCLPVHTSAEGQDFEARSEKRNPICGKTMAFKNNICSHMLDLDKTCIE